MGLMPWSKEKYEKKNRRDDSFLHSLEGLENQRCYPRTRRLWKVLISVHESISVPSLPLMSMRPREACQNHCQVLIIPGYIFASMLVSRINFLLAVASQQCLDNKGSLRVWALNTRLDLGCMIKSQCCEKGNFASVSRHSPTHLPSSTRHIFIAYTCSYIAYFKIWSLITVTKGQILFYSIYMMEWSKS